MHHTIASRPSRLRMLLWPQHSSATARSEPSEASQAPWAALPKATLTSVPPLRVLQVPTERLADRFAFHVGCPLVRGSKDAIQKFLQVGGSNKIGDLKTTLKGGHCVK
jgi:hypothetical protein